MQEDDMIFADEFCIHHNVELSFIHSLENSGLLEISRNEERILLPASQMPGLEKMVRLYYEMDINIEGIETINYLLGRMKDMQMEIMQLSNKLAGYETTYNGSS